MPLSLVPYLTGNDTQDIYNLHSYLQSLFDQFANAAGEGIDPSMGQAGGGALTIVDVPSDIVYTPGSSLSIDGVIFGHIDVSFTKPDRAVDIVVYYKEQSDGNYKQSYASTSPFRLISLKVGTLYNIQLAGQSANGSLGPLSALVNIIIPTTALTVSTPLSFAIVASYQSVILTWSAPVDGVTLEYEVQRADDATFTFDVQQWRVDATKFIDDTGVIGIQQWYKVRAVDKQGGFSAYTSPLSTVTLNIPDDSVVTSKLVDANVTTIKVANDAITYAKIQNITESRLNGRGQGSGSGDMQELTVGSDLSLVGTTLSVLPIIDTFTITATGFTTSVTGTARYVLLGTIVILFIPSLTGTSNATTLTLTGLPAAIQPTQTSFEELRVADNGIDLLGIARLNSGSGTIDIFSTVALAIWTALGTKTIYPLYICYHRS